MQRHVLLAAGLTLAPLLLLVGGLDPVADLLVDEPAMDRSWMDQVQNKTPHNATFAGGCFWCIEAAYEGKEGVAAAISGYAGGKESTATYEQVSTGTTDHREAVRVRYYPSIINYTELLDIFWRSIDPTDPGGQFTDRGPQYTTAIYAHTPRQYRLKPSSGQRTTTRTTHLAGPHGTSSTRKAAAGPGTLQRNGASDPPGHQMPRTSSFCPTRSRASSTRRPIASYSASLGPTSASVSA